MKLHVCAIRFLFDKILRRRYLVEETPYPKTPRRLPTVLTVEEVQRLIAAARTLTDRTMLMVLYSTGMRNAEMRHLQIGDIDSRAMLIHIRHGKGGHDRSRAAQCRAVSDVARALAVDAAAHVICSREPCTTGASTGRSRRRSSGMPAGTPHAEPASRNGSRPTRCGTIYPS